jgi:SAM-dependent methyltransferase
LVEHIYGAGWREPKPGFDWTRDRTKRAAAGRMPLALRENAYWSNFYAHHSYSDGSTFFAAVNSRPDTPRHVIDIGCGQGRDSQAFAAAGRRVLGLDRSEIGVRSARDAAAERGLSDRLRFAACDVSDAVAVKTALVEATDVAGDEPVLFYLRFFLHSIPEAAQETLMSAIAEHARPGDYFAAEFRTEKDEHNVKVHGKHYRRFQNGPAFGARLGNDYGFTVLDEQEGTGLSPYGDEDPELYRVVARRS